MVQDAGGAKGSQIMLPQDAVDHRKDLVFMLNMMGSQEGF